MRDHKAHGALMLGGMWGTRLNPETRKVWKKCWEGMLKDRRSKTKTAGCCGPDQQLLASYVWKNFGGRDSCMQHDSYLCTRYTLFEWQGQAGKELNIREPLECLCKELQDGPTNLLESLIQDPRILT